MSEIKRMSFVLAMKDYFGMREGETTMGFLQELKALSDEEKQWFRENLPKVGYEIAAITDSTH